MVHFRDHTLVGYLAGHSGCRSDAYPLKGWYSDTPFSHVGRKTCVTRAPFRPKCSRERDALFFVPKCSGGSTRRVTRTLEAKVVFAWRIEALCGG